MRQWTPAQIEAIEARGSNLLVSAAAGSGKTAVLTERILSLIKEGARVDEMLVVTFTRAAAAEMRTRILEALYRAADAGDPHLAAQALQVERADISTLHGFCAQVCRDHFQAAGVDPMFRVADGAQSELLRQQAVEEALTACYERNTSIFEYAAACLSQESLRQAVLQLHRFLMSRPNPWQWLEAAVAEHYVTPESLAQSEWARVLTDAIALQTEMALDAYDALVRFAGVSGLFEAFAREERAKAQEFAAAARQGYGALAGRVPTVFIQKPRKRKDMDPLEADRFTALRDDAKKALQNAEKWLDIIKPIALRADDEAGIGLVLGGIAEAAFLFDERFTALKEERNLLDFSDLEHRAYQALSVPSVADTVRAKYRYIFVDEYQDSSLLQEAILQAIRQEDNLFMVGDVKQSIYRFRLAEPGLFMRKLEEYKDEAGAVGRKIILSANFRAHERLLRAANGVFENVFCGGPMELTYGPQERLQPGRTQDWPGAATELHLVMAQADMDEEEEDAPTAAELLPEARQAIRQEAEVLADRIIALQNAPDGPYRFRDMAILMRTVRGKAAQVVEVLRSRGIPAWSDLGENALDRPEIRAMVSLLQAIDNLHQDIPLIAALRGPALGLTDDLLAQIRIETPEGTFAEAVVAYMERGDALAIALRDFVRRAREWAMDAQVLPLDRFVRMLYEETGLYAQSGASADGDLRQANLRMLAEHAGAYQSMQAGGLGSFLRYLEKIRAQEGLAAQELGDRDDVVRVLSMHKSKGLQFPVVLLAGLGRKFRKVDTKQPLHMHNILGIGLPHVDPQLRTRRITLSQRAIEEKYRQEAVAEEARLLYVAMTRAERRLVLVGSAGEKEEERWHRPITRAMMTSASSMLDWIAPVALGAGDEWEVFRHTRLRPPMAAVSATQYAAIARAARAFAEPPAESEVASVLSWSAAAESARPLKQSVSARIKAWAKPGEREESPDDFLTLPQRPLFMEERGLTAVERGDAVHAFLSAVPLETQDLRAARRSMIEKGILSEQQAKALPVKQLKTLLGSPLWQELASAREVHREWPFILREVHEGKVTLLQGVIDCCFLRGDTWVLIDYKTDRADDTQRLVEQYRPQLVLYAQALETMTQTPVAERILYLLERNEVCLV